MLKYARLKLEQPLPRYVLCIFFPSSSNVCRHLSLMHQQKKLDTNIFSFVGAWVGGWVGASS
jgi:hypothetical protein